MMRENGRAARGIPARPGTAENPLLRGLFAVFEGCFGTCAVPQTALPAVHSLHGMFQPLSPLSGATVLSGEFLTITTSPMRELS